MGPHNCVFELMHRAQQLVDLACKQVMMQGHMLPRWIAGDYLSCIWMTTGLSGLELQQ